MKELLIALKYLDGLLSKHTADVYTIAYPYREDAMGTQAFSALTLANIRAARI